MTATGLRSSSDASSGSGFYLRGKRILLISPDRWGAMRLSKHHYAVELARRGNMVYYLAPPDTERRMAPTVEPLEDDERLRIVNFGVRLPLWLRYKARPIYDMLLRAEVERVLRKLGDGFDIVWCFDGNTYTDLRWFRAPVRLYQPVDQVFGPHQRRLGESAHAILSVSREILDAFEGIRVPRHLVPHGLADEFVRRAAQRDVCRRRAAGPPRVGYIGSLFAAALDRRTFADLVRRHPNVEFHVWSPVSLAESNVAGVRDASAHDFVAALAESPNVLLRGVRAPSELVGEVEDMDALLLCYDIRRDQNRGSNSHKILEYLSTGKVVVANRVSSYGGSDLLRMSSRDDNSDLASLLSDTLVHLAHHNAPERQRRRIEFAVGHSYHHQIERIESILRPLVGGAQ